MYTISPELGSISADALPSTKETSATTEGVPEVPSVVTTFLDAAEVAPTTAFAALDSNARTTPASVCTVGDWKYLTIWLVESQETTVPLAVPPVTVCDITSSTT